jgi:hypothetical protein
MTMLPCKNKNGPCTHRLIHPTFIHEIVVTPENLAEIANALGIRGSKLTPGGTLHVLHELTANKNTRKRKR